MWDEKRRWAPIAFKKQPCCLKAFPSSNESYWTVPEPPPFAHPFGWMAGTALIITCISYSMNVILVHNTFSKEGKRFEMLDYVSIYNGIPHIDKYLIVWNKRLALKVGFCITWRAGLFFKCLVNRQSIYLHCLYSAAFPKSIVRISAS